MGPRVAARHLGRAAPLGEAGGRVQYLRQVTSVANRQRVCMLTDSKGMLDVRGQDEIASPRVQSSKGLDPGKPDMLRVQLALHGVYVPITPSNDEVHLASGLVLPIEETPVTEEETECVQHQVFPKYASIFRPKARPTLFEGNESCIEAVAFRPGDNFPFPSTMKRTQ